jgi:hypothetical protein
MGVDGDNAAAAVRSAVAFNPSANEAFVVWCGDHQTPPLVDDEFEVWGQRVNAGTGVLIGSAVRISFVGTDGDPSRSGCYPDIAYNSVDHEYLAVWEGDELIDGKFEISGRRVDAADGSLLGSQFVIGTMEPAADASYDAYDAAVAHDPFANEYLVVWSGVTITDPVAAGKFEIFGQRLAGQTGAAIGARFMISTQGETSGAIQWDFDASFPDVVFNPVEREYLVVWQGVNHVSLCTYPCIGANFTWWEIFAQRIDAQSWQEIGSDYRISDMSPLGQGGVIVRLCSNKTCYEAFQPSAAFNPDTNEYLVTWYGDEDGSSAAFEFDIHGQRLSGATGAEVGTNDFRVSDVGIRGDASSDAYRPVVGYQTSTGSFFVAWECDPGSPLANEEYEIWGQWLAGADTALDGAALRISAMGPDNSASFGAFEPAMTPVGSTGSFLAVWEGNDDDPTLHPEEFEVWGSIVRAAQIFADGFEVGTSAWSGVVP